MVGRHVGNGNGSEGVAVGDVVVGELVGDAVLVGEVVAVDVDVGLGVAVVLGLAFMHLS